MAKRTTQHGGGQWGGAFGPSKKPGKGKQPSKNKGKQPGKHGGLGNKVPEGWLDSLKPNKKPSNMQESVSNASSSAGSSVSSSSNTIDPTPSFPTLGPDTAAPAPVEEAKKEEVKEEVKKEEEIKPEVKPEVKPEPPKPKTAKSLSEMIKGIPSNVDIKKELSGTGSLYPDSFQIGNTVNEEDFTPAKDNSGLPSPTIDMSKVRVPGMFIPAGLKDKNQEDADDLSIQQAIASVPKKDNSKKEIDENGKIGLYFSDKAKPKEMTNATQEEIDEITKNNPELAEKLKESAKGMIDKGTLNLDKQKAAIDRGGEVDYDYNATASGKYEQAYNIGNAIRNVSEALGLTAEEYAKAMRDSELVKIAGEDDEFDLLDYMRKVFKVDDAKAKVAAEKLKTKETKKSNREIVTEELEKRKKAAQDANTAAQEKYNNDVTEWSKADKAARQKLVDKAKSELARIPTDGPTVEEAQKTFDDLLAKSNEALAHLKNVQADPNTSVEERKDALKASQDATNLASDAEKELAGAQWTDERLKDLNKVIKSAGREIPGKLQSTYVKDEVPPVPVMPEMNMDWLTLTEWDIANELGLDISSEEEHRFVPEEDELAEQYAEVATDSISELESDAPGAEWELYQNGSVIASSEEFKQMTEEYNKGYATPKEVENINKTYEISPEELIANPELTNDVKGQLDFVNAKLDTIKSEMEEYKKLEKSLDPNLKEEYHYWKSVASNMNMKISQTAIDTASLSADISEKNSVDAEGNKVGIIDRYKAGKTSEEMLELAWNTTSSAIEINPMNMTKLSNSQIAIMATPAGADHVIDNVIGSPEASSAVKTGVDTAVSVVKEVLSVVNPKGDSALEALFDISLTGQRATDRAQHSDAINALMSGDLEAYKELSDKVISEAEVYSGHYEGSEPIRHQLEMADAGIGVPGKVADVIKTIAGAGQVAAGLFIPGMSIPGAMGIVADGTKLFAEGATGLLPDNEKKQLEEDIKKLEEGLSHIEEIIKPEDITPGPNPDITPPTPTPDPDTPIEEQKEVDDKVIDKGFKPIVFDPDGITTTETADKKTNIIDETQQFRPGEGVEKINTAMQGFNRGMKDETTQAISDEDVKGFISRVKHDPLIIAFSHRL